METCGVDKTIFSVVLTSEVYVESAVTSGSAGNVFMSLTCFSLRTTCSVLRQT